jgi:hypothetical protein
LFGGWPEPEVAGEVASPPVEVDDALEPEELWLTTLVAPLLKPLPPLIVSCSVLQSVVPTASCAHCTFRRVRRLLLGRHVYAFA